MPKAPMETAKPVDLLSRPVTGLFGVGKERAELLKKLEIQTVGDLLLHRPNRYEDRRNLRAIAELQADELALARGTIVDMGVKWFRMRAKSVFELIVDDGTGRLYCRWWNLPFLEKSFEKGQEVVVCGKIKDVKPRTIEHPETEIVDAGEERSIHLNRITPVYPLTDGLAQRWLRGLIFRTLKDARFLDEKPPQSSGAGETQGLPDRSIAIRNLHFPEEMSDIEPARRRLAFDEFHELQKQIRARRRNFESKSKALPCRGDNRMIKPFLARLGFKLTEAQTRVLREIRADMAGEHPMRRLLQGDVGSGKTVVAACCALMALESGYDAALMAPTEILAEQHFANFSTWLRPLGVEVVLLTGTGRKQELNGLNKERPRLTIGTQALIHSGYAAKKLGLVIIDEQHRFGVAQREQLLRKGNYPHLLVMTATPIPRTLGLTIYGDLDVSVIENLPPGRGRIQTFVRKRDKLPEVFKFISSQLRTGRQAYVLFARVEDTTEADVKAVTKEFAVLQQAFKPHRVGMLHGRLRPEERDDVMRDFRANRIQVLLATSLIEVGVDVPDATIMLIENAEQFGLAQLHQLRGRIGRGAHQSYCILVAGKESRESQIRLNALAETNDGFKIAETDLKLRGPGELLGQQQSGLPRFRFGDLVKDYDLIELARSVVKPAGPLPTLPQHPSAGNPGPGIGR